MAEARKQIKILLVSDIHENWDNIAKLVAREQPGSYDLVFVSGDQANCNNKIEADDTHANNEQAE